ncbi:unnamed protein product, partial [Rotaria sordida]
MALINIGPKTWFDYFPNEIIFHIFEYLSTNDIIYTFFYFNRRLNNLLLKNQGYFAHMKLITTSLNMWKHIRPIVASYVQSMHITTIDLPIPLRFFPNLKSIIISLPYDFPDEQLYIILNSDQFKNLHTFKIKQIETFHDRVLDYRNLGNDSYLLNEIILQTNILTTIFNNRNSLKTFEYSPIILPFRMFNKNRFQTNYSLHSLTLAITYFDDIFFWIKYTPNLKYLNVQSRVPYDHENSLNKIDAKLEYLYLKLNYDHGHNEEIWPTGIDFIQLKNGIIQFSSSLICLSLNLVDSNIRPRHEFPFKGDKLKALLSSMTKLKRFHFYAQLNGCDYISEDILSRFKDHHWSFGTHENYIYTLPFHFDYLHCFKHLNDIKSNNQKILKTNPRIWHHVKTIALSYESICDESLMQYLKIMMPNLTTIKFDAFEFNDIKNLFVRSNIQLTNVTTVRIKGFLMEIGKDWLINALPNLKHLILCNIELPSIE